MGAAENLAVHTRWTAAENNHDVSHHAEFVHDDVELFAGGELIVGIDALCASVAANWAGLPDFHTALDDQFATDDRVVCRWTMSGTHEGEFFGIAPTGTRLEFRGISLWEFDSGKARRGWAMLDVASLMKQLGFA